MFSIVAFATLVHVLVTSVRRRRRDLAILRTIGFTRRQISRTVAWQAATIAAAALAIGIPLGVVVGRFAWSLFASRLGVVPVAGDLVSAGVGLYLAFEARQLGASRWLQARMIGNLLLDFLVGAVPVLGDFFDVLFRAHQRNLSLLQRELGEPYIDASR